MRNQSILCLQKRLVSLDMRFLILFTQSMRKPNAQLAYFSSLFLSVGRLWIGKSGGQELILVYFWAMSDEPAGLGSPVNDVSPERNFQTQFRTWWSLMTP